MTIRLLNHSSQCFPTCANQATCVRFRVSSSLSCSKRCWKIWIMYLTNFLENFGTYFEMFFFFFLSIWLPLQVVGILVICTIDSVCQRQNILNRSPCNNPLYQTICSWMVRYYTLQDSSLSSK